MPTCKVGETGDDWDIFCFCGNTSVYQNHIKTDSAVVKRLFYCLQSCFLNHLLPYKLTMEIAFKDSTKKCPNVPRYGVNWDSAGVHWDKSNASTKLTQWAEHE